MPKKNNFKYKTLCVRFLFSIRDCKKFLTNEKIAYLFKNHDEYVIDDWLLTVKQKRQINDLMKVYNALIEYLSDEEKQRLLELGGQL